MRSKVAERNPRLFGGLQTLNQSSHSYLFEAMVSGLIPGLIMDGGMKRGQNGEGRVHRWVND